MAVVSAASGAQVSTLGGGGRDAISLGVQPSSPSTPTPTATTGASPLAAVAASAVLALAAVWAASSFARERGAVSSSASAAGLRGGGRNEKKKKKKKKRGLALLGFGAPSSSSTSSSLLPPRTYREALSVTRRSVALTRAVQAADFGNIAGALTELDRALAEHLAAGGRWGSKDEGEEEESAVDGSDNGRPPLLPSGAGEEDMRRLYILHLQNSDLPAMPGDLEPLRSLLRIGSEEAAEVEAEVLSQSGGFSI